MMLSAIVRWTYLFVSPILSMRYIVPTVEQCDVSIFGIEQNVACLEIVLIDGVADA